MIRREDSDFWLLISQVDHAYLAGDLAAAWGNPQVAELPEPDLLVPAVRDHDEGWREWEKSPKVDAGRGVPRDFLEMPMTDATAIWRRSIDVSHRREKASSATIAQFQQFLTTRSKRLTPDRTVIARMALGIPGAFDAERVVERAMAADPAREYSRSTIYRTLGWLEDAGLLVRDPRVRDRHIYRTVGRPSGPSPWAGLWVSRHFAFLAEKAREHRHGDDDESLALAEFLADQKELQQAWRAAGVDELGEEESERLEALGFRWLQFFDRLSLWLCCAPRNLTEQMPLPTGGMMHFTPLKSGEIAVEPFPFRSDELAVAVTARRIAATPLASNQELAEALSAAPLETLRWAFVRW